MSEYAPVAVLEPACRCSRCLGAYRIVLAALEPPPSIGPYPFAKGQRRDPQARAAQILADEFARKEAP